MKNVSYADPRKVIGEIDVRSFKKLRPVAYKSRCKIHIVGRRGPIFFLEKCKRRKVFFIEGICAALIIFFLSTIIADIEVNIPITMSEQKVRELLAENGIHIGMFKYEIDDEALVKNIISSFDEVSWAEVSIKGTKIQVDIAQEVARPNVVPYTEPCDVVALKEGVIYSMNVKSGIAAVEPGDTVMAGDVIISGKIADKYDENIFYNVHAHGEVIASTWYSEKQVVNTVKTERVRTGNFTESMSLNILGLEFKLFGWDHDYEEYDELKEESSPMLWGKIKLPIQITKKTLYECEEQVINIDGDTAMQLARESAYAKCLEQIPDSAEIVNAKFSYETVQNDGICVTVIVECKENIAKESAID